MSKCNSGSRNFLKLSILFAGLCVSLITGCAVSAKDSSGSSEPKPETRRAADIPDSAVNNLVPKGRIQTTQGSPADTVRIFYKNLREKRFREAMMMTNLRSAIVGLTDSEMQDLNSDFEPLSQQVPEDLGINGEIISGNSATVTAKIPDETGKVEINEIQLRLEKEQWVILTADAAAEQAAKKEGKNYFFRLRMDVHHDEAQKMMERIAKAETVYALQNAGTFSNLQTLISQHLLPEDVLQTKSTGYHFNVVPSSDNLKYVATAEPQVYGKSGKLSFIMVSEGAGMQARLRSEDNKGLPLKK